MSMEFENYHLQAIHHLHLYALFKTKRVRLNGWIRKSLLTPPSARNLASMLFG
jgi:hypothetical protein